jgi:hypothetical protein
MAARIMMIVTELDDTGGEVPRATLRPWPLLSRGITRKHSTFFVGNPWLPASEMPFVAA